MSAATERFVRLPTRHAGQRQIVAESARFNVLQCGRRFGKTTLGVDLAVDKALDGLPVGWFAPTYKLLDEAWRDVRKAVADVVVTVDKQQRRLELLGGGVIEFWSLDHTDPGRGRKYARVILDEAGIVRDLEIIWTQAIRATLTDLKGDAWFLGTPKGRNYFHTLFLRGQQGDHGWKSWRFATVQNPYLDPAEIEDARGELPDLAFRQEYLGEAVEDGSNPFGIAFIHACIVPHLSVRPTVAYGVDLAKAVDHTVILGLDEEKVASAFDRFQKPWQETFETVRRAVKKLPALVDSSGVGDPILERLHREGGDNFMGFKFTAVSRQQGLEGLAAAIQRKEIRFPDGPIVRELEAFGYEYTRTGGVKYCLAPDTKVVTADLRWVPVSTVLAGDALLAFDEYPVTGKRGRRWRRSLVESSRLISRPCYEVTFDDGTAVTASQEHLWLVDTGQGGFEWRRTDQLRAPHPTSASTRFSPSRVVKLLPVWSEERSYEAGYLAAAFDGEGCLTQRPRRDRESGHSFRMSFAQRDNSMACRVREYLTAANFGWSESTNGSVLAFGVTGRQAEVLRLLGRVRPARLLAKLDVDKLGTAYMISSPAVASLTPVGERPVVALGTSTRTLIAEGMASHNSAPEGVHDDCVMALMLAHEMHRRRASMTGSYQLARTASYAPRKAHA